MDWRPFGVGNLYALHGRYSDWLALSVGLSRLYLHTSLTRTANTHYKTHTRSLTTRLHIHDAHHGDLPNATTRSDPMAQAVASGQEDMLNDNMNQVRPWTPFVFSRACSFVLFLGAFVMDRNEENNT